jgi:hypothetical protein
MREGRGKEEGTKSRGSGERRVREETEEGSEAEERTGRERERGQGRN